MRNQTLLSDSRATELARQLENRRPGTLHPIGPGPGSRGRPHLAKGQPSVKVQAWMPQSMAAKLERAARNQHTTVSAVLRAAVRGL